MANFIARAPLLCGFLEDFSAALRGKDSGKLGILFTMSPDGFSQNPNFQALSNELKRECPKGHEAQLEALCEKATPHELAQLKPLILSYLQLLRDSNRANADNINKSVKYLTDQSIIALGDPTLGSLVLFTVLNLSRQLAQTASRTRKSELVEDSANTLRDAFIKCLVGGGIGKAAHETRPEGKRTGVYLTANACLRLLFLCRKLRNAQQMFISIDAQSPFLSFYPRAQRVTYLFYLGRYHFANSHFYRSQLALQEAYEICHRQAIQHRKHVLTYLIAANICLGRFPLSNLLSRPEASTIALHFQLLCKIIKLGDLGSFHAYLDLDNISAQWFLQKRILLQLRNRCEVLVWRSLIRKTFKYAGTQPEGRIVPSLRLGAVQLAARFSIAKGNIQHRSQPVFSTFARQNQSKEEDYTDPELAGLDEAINDTGYDFDSSTYFEDQIDKHQHSILVNGTRNQEQGPTIREIESIMASLIQQGFLKGFLTHNNPRFAIPGAKERGPLAVGFPNIWEVIKNREDDVVPGWVRKEEHKAGRNVFGGGMRTGPGAAGGGRVVNLSGARPVGAGS